MNLNNLENLQQEMESLGFQKALVAQMEEKMKANLAEFKLYDSVSATKGRVDMTLFFKQSSQSDYYYLNKFEVCHEKGLPIPQGSKVMVYTTPEGADKGMVKNFVHVSQAIAFFNEQKQELKVGQTYRTSPINQTIYVEKGKGFSSEQAVNLIQGRAVFRDDMVSQAGQQYKAWIKLDFDVPKDRFGNFMMNQYTDPSYGFDLAKVLDKFEIKELADPVQREILERSIRNGNRATVTVDKNGEKVKLEIEAAPRYSQINMFTKQGRPEKREQFLKAEDFKQGRDRAHNKNKVQGQGIGV
jgi:hypothetical protein